MQESSETKSNRPTADIPAMPDDLLSAAAEAASATTEAASAAVAASAPPQSISTAASVPPLPASQIDYGLLDSLRAGQASVTEATQKFIQKLGDYLSAALDDATSLEVRTYVSEDIGTVTYEKGQLTGGARLRAMTRVNIDGDSLVCVPETDGELDTAVWQIHMDMLKQAQESRADLMRTMVAAAGSLANIFVPKA